MLTQKLTPLYTAIALTLGLSNVAFAENDNAKWQVNMPENAPLEKIDINVTEGTWMNINVSPDGKSIVFDLLGDIYQMPISGGEAKPLAQGIAWQMHQHYPH